VTLILIIVSCTMVAEFVGMLLIDIAGMDLTKRTAAGCLLYMLVGFALFQLAGVQPSGALVVSLITSATWGAVNILWVKS